MVEQVSRPWVRVVAGVVLNQAGDYLLSSRPEGKPYAGYWEFAGGKVEANESEFAALQREFAEELGITIHRAKPWLTKVHVYEHAHVHLRFFWITANDWSGEVQAKEGQQWSWQRAGDFDVSPMLPANGPILAALAVPTAFRGNLQQGLLGHNSAGEYRVLPYSRAEGHNQAVLLTQDEVQTLGKLPTAHSVWVVVRNAVEFAASQDADVLLWQVQDDVAAQQVLQQLHMGVALPLLVYADTGFVERYQASWLAAGAHAVVVNDETDWV